MTMPDCWAVVPAAGVGRRMGGDRPKQYLPLVGRTVIEYSLQALLAHPRVVGVVVAIGQDDPYWTSVRPQADKPVETVLGGAERCDSVLNGLRSLATKLPADHWVMVHDAARPCLQAADVDSLIAAASGDPIGGILAMPVRDTIKRADAEARIEVTVDRTDLWQALTPQMFRLGMLVHALELSLARGFQVTDEASAMERAGWFAKLVAGRADNIKVTRPEDLPLAERFLQQRADAL